jgi:hypothetical protein
MPLIHASARLRSGTNYCCRKGMLPLEQRGNEGRDRSLARVKEQLTCGQLDWHAAQQGLLPAHAQSQPARFPMKNTHLRGLRQPKHTTGQLTLMRVLHYTTTAASVQQCAVVLIPPAAALVRSSRYADECWRAASVSEHHHLHHHLPLS